MFPCIYIYSIYCGDIYELNARSAPGAPALGSRLPRGPRQPSFPNRLCYQFYLIWAIFFFPCLSSVFSPPPKLLSESRRIQRIGENARVSQPDAPTNAGPWRGKPVLSPEHRTPLDRAAAALDYSYEYLKEESCMQTPEAEKAGRFL